MIRQELPPVIVALDVSSANRAHTVMRTIDDYDRSQIALQFRASRLMAEGDGLVQEAREADWNVIIATRFGDKANKMALDIDTTVKDSDTNPWGITLETPHRSSEGIEELKIAISRARGLGVHTISFSRSDRFHPNDYDHIAETDFDTWVKSKEFTIDATEIAYNGLDNFFRLMELQEKNLQDGPALIVSHIPYKEPGTRRKASRNIIHTHAQNAFGYGVTSLLLGDSIVEASDPADIIDAVLEAHEEQH